MKAIPVAVSRFLAFFPQALVAAPLFVSTVGPGSVEVLPVKIDYTVGEKVHLKAVADPFGEFQGWGDGYQGAERDVTIEAAIQGPSDPMPGAYIPHPNRYRGQFINTVPVEDQIAMERQKSFPVPLDAQSPAVFSIGSEVLFSNYGYYGQDGALSGELLRFTAEGAIRWQTTNFWAADLLVQSNEEIWLPDRANGVALRIVNGAGQTVASRHYAEGTIYSIRTGQPGETLLQGARALAGRVVPVNLAVDGNGAASTNRYPPGFDSLIVPAANGGYVSFELSQGPGTSHNGTAFRFLDSFFVAEREYLFPWNVASGISLSDDRVVSVVREMATGGFRLVLVSPDGSVLTNFPALGALRGPALVAGSRSDWWALQNTVATAEPGGADPRLTHYGPNGELLSEIPLPAWDPEYAKLLPIPERPGWMRAVGLTTEEARGNPASRSVVRLEFTSRRVLPGTPQVWINASPVSAYVSTNEIEVAITCSHTGDQPVYVNLDGAATLDTARPYQGPFRLNHSALIRALSVSKEGTVLASDPVSVELRRQAELRMAISAEGNPVLDVFTTNALPPLETSTDLVNWWALPAPPEAENGVLQLEFKPGAKTRFFRIPPAALRKTES